MARANPRGLATLRVNGRDLKLKLTLEVMADIEDEFECDFDEIDSKIFGSTRRFAIFFTRLARAAGEEVTEEDTAAMRRLPLSLVEINELIKAAATGAAETDAKNETAPSR